MQKQLYQAQVENSAARAESGCPPYRYRKWCEEGRESRNAAGSNAVHGMFSGVLRGLLYGYEDGNGNWRENRGFSK